MLRSGFRSASLLTVCVAFCVIWVCVSSKRAGWLLAARRRIAAVSAAASRAGSAHFLHIRLLRRPEGQLAKRTRAWRDARERLRKRRQGPNFEPESRLLNN